MCNPVPRSRRGGGLAVAGIAALGAAAAIKSKTRTAASAAVSAPGAAVRGVSRHSAAHRVPGRLPARAPQVHAVTTSPVIHAAAPQAVAHAFPYGPGAACVVAGVLVLIALCIRRRRSHKLGLTCAVPQVQGTPVKAEDPGFLQAQDAVVEVQDLGTQYRLSADGVERVTVPG